MPFQPIDFVPRTTAIKSASMSYKRNDRAGKTKNKKPILIVAVPSALVPSFKPVESALYDLHIGTGEDAGKARIMRGEKGVTCRQFKNAFVFRFGFIPLLGDDAAERDDIGCRSIDKGSFEVDLPPWFKSDHAESREESAPPPRIPLRKAR